MKEEIRPAEPDAVQSTEAYETEEGVVLFDVENPTAWVQARVTLDLHQMV